jgi:hypothetical protein
LRSSGRFGDAHDDFDVGYLARTHALGDLMVITRSRIAGFMGAVADRVLGSAISESYHLAKLRSRLDYLALLDKEPLLVYQMGKVGSTTIVNSLHAAADIDSKYSVYHVHWLSPERLRYEEDLHISALARRAADAGTPAGNFHPEYVWAGQHLSRRLRNQRDTTKWTVITLLREPISRNISSFFQNLETLLNYDFRTKLKSTSVDQVVNDLLQLFTENYIVDGAIERSDANPMTWFDKELKTVFGVDVYASPFPREQGYATFETPRARVLLLRLEDLNKTNGESVKTFMGSQDFKLVSANQAHDKEYSQLYQAFARRLVLPSAYVESIYRSRYSTHFYTPRELDRFRAKWDTSPREITAPGV